MHLQYLCIFDCHIDIDVGIYSTCAFLSVCVCVKCFGVDVCIYSTYAFFDCHVLSWLFVMLILMYAFIILVLF